MKILHAIVVAALSLGLTGCVVSEQKFVQYRTVIKNNPHVRAQFISKCVASLSTISSERRELIAAMADMKTATMPQTFCRRIGQAFTSGRMTYQDYKDIMHKRPTPRLIRMIRGQ